MQQLGIFATLSWQSWYHTSCTMRPRTHTKTGPEVCNIWKCKNPIIWQVVLNYFFPVLFFFSVKKNWLQFSSILICLKNVSFFLWWLDEVKQIGSFNQFFMIYPHTLFVKRHFNFLPAHIPCSNQVKCRQAVTYGKNWKEQT